MATSGNRRSNTSTKSAKSAPLPIIWVLGGPLSGKSTQCEKIAAHYGFTHLGSKILIQDEVVSGSDKGKALAEILKQGNTISNTDVLILMEQAMRKHLGTTKGFTMVFYPKENEKASTFEKEIGSPNLIIYLDCADGTLAKRIMARNNAVSQAPSEEDVVLKTRIATFRQITTEFLKNHLNKTIQLDGDGTIDEIFIDIKAAIDEMLTKL